MAILFTAINIAKFSNISFLIITTFLQAIFLWKIVYMVWNAMGKYCILLLPNPVAIPNVFEDIQLFLQDRDHEECKQHPEK